MRELDLTLGLRIDSFLRWARDRGEPVPARAATLLLLLFAWRGAKVRGGLPEPTAGLVRQIFGTDLPGLAAGGEADASDYPRVAALLVDRRRADGLLNAKRQEKLRSVITEVSAEFHQTLAAPARSTWPRFYGALLRADGVDPSDPSAVRGWLAGYRKRSFADRRAAMAVSIAVMTRQTENVELATQTLLVRHHQGFADLMVRYERLRDGGGAASASTAATADDDAWRHELIDNTAEAGMDVLMDLGSAAGLSRALRMEFRDLAPRLGDRGADRLLDELVELIDDDVCTPLPVMDEPPVEELAAAVRASPLLAAAADLAVWVDDRGGVPKDADGAAGRWPGASDLGLAGPVRRELDEIALATDLLRRVGGELHAGDGLVTWNSGDPHDLAVFGLDALGGVLVGLTTLTAQRPSVDDGKGELLATLVRELPFLLIRMVGEIHVSYSLARLAAEHLAWRLPLNPPNQGPATMSADGPSADAGVLRSQLRLPDADGTRGNLAYQLPSDAELARLIGLPNLEEEDRAELLDVAGTQAVLVDRCAALGVMRREDDRIALTPLGVALLRTALVMAGGEAPTTADLAVVGSDTVVGWLEHWPPHAHEAGVLAWVNAHGGGADAWQAILAASAGRSNHGVLGLLGAVQAAAPGAPVQPEPGPALLSLSDPQDEAPLLTALATFVDHPVIGAYTVAVLRQRGQIVADPPLSARAVVIGDHLSSLLAEARMRAIADELNAVQGLAADAPRREPSESGSPKPVGVELVCAAFDQAALDWPGGPQNLVRHLVATDVLYLMEVLRVLGEHHPDQAIARPSGAAADARDRPPSERRGRSSASGRTSARPARKQRHR
ncbi:conserved hypothetical protein [Frankia canadensis]|uniref:Uncharacterized protein n=1 Tax=Frankia canadensis TaxID=1836972 RepID=A0A2I2L0F7_9ACTN|nr:hypothetical protein [Frankia canadensis]SNQ51413.1 conserved hypothetical protein [Frankia canadensis]SOU58703.1 conserved hypothetical protein [Frankia canadensis]